MYRIKTAAEELAEARLQRALFSALKNLTEQAREPIPMFRSPRGQQNLQNAIAALQMARKFGMK